MMPDDESYPGDKLRKLRYVNNYLQQRAMLAWCCHQYMCIDESMCKCASRMCAFLQMMKAKPIKLGPKNFCLVDSGDETTKCNYLYKWEWYLGPSDESKGYVYGLIHDRLLDGSFDGIGHVILADNYFVMIALWCILRARGIYAIGPSKVTQ